MIELIKSDLQGIRGELYTLFKEHNMESPSSNAGLILMHILGINKTQLLANNYVVPIDKINEIAKMAERRISGEPIQYIIGSCDFFGLEFFVNPSTLIPRPETELLVEELKKRFDLLKPTVLWDIGCGSGCIGISLAYMCCDLRVFEIDISPKAIETAKATAIKYGLDDRIDFIEQDILRGMPDIPKPQVIVSNPPYIPSGDIADLQREVKDFEPISALDGGLDGLVFYRKIIEDNPLEEGGLLAFEIGFDQGEKVVELMQNSGYKEVELLKDLAGLDRIVLGYR